jgi:hypothetical protein
MVLSRPGSVFLTYRTPEETALWHELVDFRRQVSMIEEKPASLPPIVMLTRVVDELSDESWLPMTSPVVAPAHAAN